MVDHPPAEPGCAHLSHCRMLREPKTRSEKNNLMFIYASRDYFEDVSTAPKKQIQTKKKGNRLIINGQKN